MIMRKITLILLLSVFGGALAALHPTPETPIAYPTHGKQMIIFVWDGLRPDSITRDNTPNLYALMQQGTTFTQNHSSYPTLTMMNAASFSTGDFAGRTGFYGNTLWNPKATGRDAANHPVDFSEPVFTEDYKILRDLHQAEPNVPLLAPMTLFEAAHKAHLKTAAVGKVGPASMQDYLENTPKLSIVLDEKHVYPLSVAKYWIATHTPIPVATPYAYPPQALTVPPYNGNPTAAGPILHLEGIRIPGQPDQVDGITPDPHAATESPYSRANAYLMDTYLTRILPEQSPVLSVIWLRNPDTTEHQYGVGPRSYQRALQDQDRLLGKLQQRLTAMNAWHTTDLIIVSDHGHSNVSGPLSIFPLRTIQNRQVTVINPNGYSVSGSIRPADLLTRAGFHAYDGMGCVFDPVLSGITAAGLSLYPTQWDKTGQRCGKPNTPYTTPAYRVPTPFPTDGLVIAENGGSTYVYAPSHNPALVAQVVRFLQSRPEFDAVFVDDRYANIPGTFPLSLVHLENVRKAPDIIVASTYDSEARIAGMPGIEASSGAPLLRGMHGSFSPRDVHNVLIAAGPDFKTHFQDPLPSGNVDVAPTVAYLLHIAFPHRDGRVLHEALVQDPGTQPTQVTKVYYVPKTPATGLPFYAWTDTFNQHPTSTQGTYTQTIWASLLTLSNGQQYLYLDQAKAERTAQIMNNH